MKDSLFELLGLAVFFIVYKAYDLNRATAALIVITSLLILIKYIRNKELSKPNIITFLLLLIFGGMAFLSNDSTFIKMKPTAVYVLFAVTLETSILMKKNILKNVMSKVFVMTNTQWNFLSKIWSMFFLLCAITNEIVWRNYEESTWVTFKVFIMPALMFIFLISQIIILKKRIQIK